MPVTKTAKRALRGSTKKLTINKRILGKLDIAIKAAKKSKNEAKVRLAMALADRASKKKVIHKNKASRIKSVLSKVLPKPGKTKKSAKTQRVRSPKKTKSKK